MDHVGSSVLPLSLFFSPLWKITLGAPQYPEGLSMYIHINKIADGNRGDLQNINLMNHYVGMKNIEPDSIPELTYFPYIVMALSVLGLLLVFTNNWKLWALWVGIFIALGILGIYDFYLWEYDYGHDLNPHAAIKIEGMAYDPPVFGRKILLNFVVDSYPATGGYLAGISILMAMVATWFKRKKD
jgi:copper chaperone NosL